MKAQVRLEHELLAVEGDHEVNAMLELTAPAAPASGERPPLSLALVIDRSGSMAGRKLEVARECAAFLVRRLGPADRLAVVAYDDQVTLVAPLATLDRPALLAAIAAIRPGNSTNLSGGWLKGMEQLQRAGDGPRKVLLLSDGLANVGITDRGELASLARNAAAAGVGTTTIGFGDGFDEDLMTGMADAGGGRAYHAPTAEQAPGIFAEEFADETRRVVFALRIPNLGRLGVARVADLVVRYVSVGGEIGLHEVTVPVMVNAVTADEAAQAGPPSGSGSPRPPRRRRS